MFAPEVLLMKQDSAVEMSFWRSTPEHIENFSDFENTLSNIKKDQVVLVLVDRGETTIFSRSQCYRLVFPVFVTVLMRLFGS